VRVLNDLSPTAETDRLLEFEYAAPGSERAGSELLKKLHDLEADRAQLAAIVEGSRDAIWSWNPDGIITRWNAEAERLFGYAKSDIIGQTLLQLVPPDRRDKARQVIQQIDNGAWYGQYQTQRLHKDGTVIEVELTVSPMKDSQGRLIGASTVCRDIRERKNTQASLARRVSELTTIYRLTERLQSAASPHDIYQAALAAISEALGCQRASILIFDPSRTMRFVAWSGLSDAYRAAVDGHSPWTADAQNPKSIYVEDIRLSNESESLKATIEGEGIRALAFIPLIANDRLIGKFMTYHPAPHKFTEDENILANTIARQLALAVSRYQSEQELKNSEQRFRLMSEHAPVMIWMSDERGHCLHLNRMLRTFWGVEESNLSNFDWSKTIHPEDITQIGELMTTALRDKASVTLKGRYKNALGRYRVLQTNARPRFSQSGVFLGMIGVNVDITEREEAERGRDLLVAELNHRVKNTLAIVQAIAHQTFRVAVSPIEARKAFEGRLTTLSAAHNLLTKTNWEKVSLKELANLTLGDGGTNSNRISLSGPDILLPPKEALSIAMALHELCTNAVKYGALANDEGRITVTWCRPDANAHQLEIRWVESGGPPVVPRTHRGFGSLLLERTLAQDLEGEVKMDFRPEGLACLIVAPMTHGGNAS
jgi:PAS domain S-box-containing protein